MIARLPGTIRPGQTSDHIGYFGDLMTTAAELAGAKPPTGLDSISFAPTLVGPTAERPQAEHRYLYWEFYEGAKPRQAVRFGKWKAICTVGGPIELHDVTIDVAEEADVSAEHADVVAEIRSILAEAHVDNEFWSFKPKR
jgi:uncharacterized sulfatase